MQILKADEGDLKQILALQYLAWQREAELLNNFNIQPLTQTLEELEQEFKSSVLLKALDETGLIIGSVRGRTDGQTLHVGKLMVHPDHQGKGIGSLLLRALEQICHMPRCELFTSSKSLSNIRLYENHGYKKFKEERGWADISFVYMEKHMFADNNT